MEAALEGRLENIEPEWRGGASCCVVMASGGYPGDYSTGYPISGISEAEAEDCRVYLAGVRESAVDSSETADGSLPAAYSSTGGRVLGVTAVEESLADAVDKAYRGIHRISFQGGWYRADIGKN